MKTLLHRLGMAIIGHDDDYDYDDDFDGTDANDDYDDYEDAAAEDDYAESSHAENGNQVAFFGVRIRTVRYIKDNGSFTINNVQYKGVRI